MDVRNASEIVKMLRDLFGEKWGKALGRIVVLVAVGAVITAFIVGLKAALISIFDLSDYINRSSSTIGRATLLAVCIMLLVGSASVLTAMLAKAAKGIISSIFTHRTHHKIDGTLNATIDLLDKANKELPNGEAGALLIEAKAIQKQWKYP